MARLSFPLIDDAADRKNRKTEIKINLINVFLLLKFTYLISKTGLYNVYYAN